ncbi:MAG: arylamine N-acetyltransferase [Balneola sp.]
MYPQAGKKIELVLGQLFDKIITNQRGGYCYELNYLFHSLLNQVGFDNHLISARIFDDGKYGPEHDHMSIIVNLNDLWLVDVGFGDLFIEPIKIKADVQQEDQFKFYKIVEINADEYILYESLKINTDFKVKYKFNSRPKAITDFDEQNMFKQTSKESYFVRNRICTIPTQNGRKTIFNNTYKVRNKGKVDLTEIKGNEELSKLLESQFNITMTTKKGI